MIYWEEEWEMILFCCDEKIVIMLYSLLVLGWLMWDLNEIINCFEMDLV